MAFSHASRGKAAKNDAKRMLDITNIFSPNTTKTREKIQLISIKLKTEGFVIHVLKESLK